MSNFFRKIERHKAVSRAQERQQIQNCALLLAYIHGAPAGWYAVVDSHIDGFRSDYAMIHSHPGDFACHPVRVFCLVGNEEFREELEEIRVAVKEAHEMDELPLVATLTEEEKEAARKKVREAWADELRAAEDEERPLTSDDCAAWLEELCSVGASDLGGTNWEAVAAAVERDDDPKRKPPRLTAISPRPGGSA